MTELDIDEFRGVLGVTIAYLTWFYATMYHQVCAKHWARKSHAEMESGGNMYEWNRYEERSINWEMGDRNFYNNVEQITPFLVSLWLHALFVDCDVSALLGCAYVFLRILYPFMWNIKGRYSFWVEVSVFPSWMIISFFQVSMFLLIAFDLNVTNTEDIPRWALILIVIGSFLAHGLVYTSLGTIVWKTTFQFHPPVGEIEMSVSTH